MMINIKTSKNFVLVQRDDYSLVLTLNESIHTIGIHWVDIFSSVKLQSCNID